MGSVSGRVIGSKSRAALEFVDVVFWAVILDGCDWIRIDSDGSHPPKSLLYEFKLGSFLSSFHYSNRSIHSGPKVRARRWQRSSWIRKSAATDPFLVSFRSVMPRVLATSNFFGVFCLRNEDVLNMTHTRFWLFFWLYCRKEIRVLNKKNDYYATDHSGLWYSMLFWAAVTGRKFHASLLVWSPSMWLTWSWNSELNP